MFWKHPDLHGHVIPLQDQSSLCIFIVTLRVLLLVCCRVLLLVAVLCCYWLLKCVAIGLLSLVAIGCCRVLVLAAVARCCWLLTCVGISCCRSLLLVAVVRCYWLLSGSQREQLPLTTLKPIFSLVWELADPENSVYTLISQEHSHHQTYFFCHIFFTCVWTVQFFLPLWSLMQKVNTADIFWKASQIVRLHFNKVQHIRPL